MVKRSSFAPIGAGLLAFGVCVGLAPAERAFAQGGGGGNNKDVRVINSAAEPVPVAVQSLPAVQITGTPTVNVGNTVPVTVTNLPAAPAAPQPITIRGDVAVQVGNDTGSLNLYFVPAGKLLVIEFLNFLFNAEDGSVHHRLEVQVTDDDEVGMSFYFVPDGGIVPAAGASSEVGSKQTQIFAGPGSPVNVYVRRTTAYSGGLGPTIGTRVVMTGHLTDVP